MSYINDLGKTIGPIKIDNIWVGTEYFNSLNGANVISARYLTPRYSKVSGSNDDLAPILARTPAITFHEEIRKHSDGTEYTVNVPDDNEKAVATIEWVMAYATLKPGSLPFDPNKYVTTDVIDRIVKRIDQMDSVIENNTSNILKNTNNINENKQSILMLDSRISTNQKVIEKNREDFDSHVENPFPTGLWLCCGDTSTLDEVI